MKTVSMREFQRKASSYINDLPIVLTNYNIPIAKVVPLYETKNVPKSILPSTIDISNEDMLIISKEYNVPLSFVRYEYEQLKNYCASSGKMYKDYKAALRNFVLRDMKNQAERRNNGRATIDARGV